MKKFAVLFLILIGALALTACSSVPAHKTLAISWPGYEKAVYEVEREVAGSNGGSSTKIMGVYTQSIEKISVNSVVVGGKTFEISGSANHVKTHLLMDNGDEVVTEVIFSNRFQPILSYRKSNKQIIKDGKTVPEDVEIWGTYRNNKYFYEGTKDGEAVENNWSTGKFDNSPYFDNEMIFWALRGVDLSAGSFSFSFKVPQWNEDKNVTLSNGLTSNSSKQKVPFKDEIECYEVTTKLNQTFPGSGSPIISYYAKSPQSATDLNGGSDISINKAIVKIVQSSVTYSLVSLEAKRDYA